MHPKFKQISCKENEAEDLERDYKNKTYLDQLHEYLLRWGKQIQEPYTKK